MGIAGVCLFAACQPLQSTGTCKRLPELSAEQCAALEGLVLPESLPPASGNARGDDKAAALLGFQVFFDARFSSTGQMRCATCHQPEKKFSDGLPSSVPELHRNSPTLLNAAWQRWQFWDGRADTLWSQPLFAFEAPLEMNSTRLEIAHLIATAQASRYEAAFGPLPDLSDSTRFPPKGKPGDAAWDGMNAEDQHTVQLMVANLGKAIEAYERKLAAGRSRVDAFILGDDQALTADERHGLAVFVQAGCTSCHGGPLFTDEKFRNLGIPPSDRAAGDPGRDAAWAILSANPFSARGSYDDGPPPPDSDYVHSASDLGAFKTPSLRNVAQSGPWGHDGSFDSLEKVIDFHLQGGGRAESGYLGEVTNELQPMTLSEADRAALVTFLGALNGQYPGLPWNNWPDG